MKLIFEKSVKGRKGFRLPNLDVPKQELPKDLIRNEKAKLPEVFEMDVVRHFENLEKTNHSIDRGFYPLGSCTMKYNPFINEELAALSGFVNLHPYIEEKNVQGALELMYNLQKSLGEITGMDAVTLQPAAGAHGELTGMLIIRKYIEDKGLTHKTKVIVPDSAHGTNPASATMAGFKAIEVKSTDKGRVDLEEYKKLMDDDVAAVMLTNPNTVGLFESDILEIAKLAHEHGALLYYDGANLNAIMGMVRPGDMGFDVVHMNLHKTFSTPHGMGGPGSGPVGVKEYLKDYLPKPIVEKTEGGLYELKYDMPKSIGRVRGLYGNFLVLVRAYAYILTMGSDGLKKSSEYAVLNANYMRVRLKDSMKMAYDEICKHEFVVEGTFLKEYGLKTTDFAKRMLDYGIHPATIYFPLIVKEAMMFEPTETESKETLDETIEVMLKIVDEAKNTPEKLHNAPFTTPVRRLNELKANKDIKVRY